MREVQAMNGHRAIHQQRGPELLQQILPLMFAELVIRIQAPRSRLCHHAQLMLKDHSLYPATLVIRMRAQASRLRHRGRPMRKGHRLYPPCQQQQLLMGPEQGRVQYRVIATGSRTKPGSLINLSPHHPVIWGSGWEGNH